MIELVDIWDLKDADDFKAHLATWNGEEHPLDVWLRSPKEWQGWQEYRPQKDDFNRRYIFSLMQFYPENNSWLFGGIFEVLGDKKTQYDVKLTDRGKKFIGRLKIGFHSGNNRNPRQNLDALYDKIFVREILPEKYSGHQFPGLDNIDIQFSALSAIIKGEKLDWKAALSNLKGVYLITDTSNNKKYVGSAYGVEGIWSRWSSYVFSYHGGNKKLVELLNLRGEGHIKRHFKFTLLEAHPLKMSDDYIISRENFWKTALISRGSDGLNIN